MSIALPARLDLGPERRYGRLAGVAAFASVAAMCGALLAANASSASRSHELGAAGAGQSKADRLRELVDFHHSPGGQALAVGLRSAGLVLSIAAGLFLYWMIRRRGQAVGRAVLWTAIVGPLLVLAATLFGYHALKDVADAFFASGPRTAARADDLIRHSGSLKAASVFDILSRIVFAVWVGVLSRQAMRVGLFTSFLGYWGIGAAICIVLVPIGDAMFIGWLASVAFLAVGYWPGGRPGAWDGVAAASDVPAL